MNLTGLTKNAFVTLFEGMRAPKWRAAQVWNWIYKNGADSFDKMTNLPAEMRARLQEEHSVQTPKIVRHELSNDGTEKFLMLMEDGNTVEMVLIPEGDRNTLCVSSQIGCCVKCAFCYTGTQAFERNLETHEIVGQVLLARQCLHDSGSLNSKRTLTNIVMMGMGEPFHNYENVANALRVLMDQDGLAFSKRRITLSTSGVVPFIKRCGEELGVNLAVSLHAPNDEIRGKLMPINKQYNVKQLIDACREYPNASDARRITFEYVMLKGVNDSEKLAKELAALIEGIPGKVNLIPWNPWEGAHFVTSPEEQIDRFANVLSRAGVTVMVRSPRGQDISAACGQLKSAMT
ncbi:MAG: 23S rRNA (adenine(2503)-C(2))-methyltransferase RlmN [Holosporales bacterium]|jgi:23S rRNA (adenine2503-C2)-methyltransferase|nr:23S rRNA (adenine(2503)-C(2))-methyltransferase RlmN [Holosporales bacterium]